ncbi:LuxR family transcriptional regulator [Microbacterium sp. RU33B]|uniref:LuxR family transcriptional regulator n=1 Tax=Microbacterium sp. RU33B TaxID=1907390 RepID=UPI002116A1F5|nr:LuxR family transcriptional regulator [Microbacterium sp. RU33B]
MREEHPVPRARIFHGVVRAAIYETIPLSQRQRLHGRAAARMPSARERLDHRVAAASGMNDGLASDLDAFADELHDARHYRQAAHTRRQAAYLSAAPDARAHRELDADFDAILALDMDDVSTLGDGTGAEPRARFIRGAQLAAERDYSAAADVLATLTDAELSDLDDRAAYRARVIRAWATISCGRSAAQAKEDIRIAETSPDPDRAIQGYLSITRGQAEFVTTAPSGPETIRALTGGERSTLAASPEGLSTLAWRGTSLSFYGLPARQIADLEIVTARLGDGIFDFGDGAFSAFQGFAYFLDGQWGRAAIALDLARVGPRLRPAPLTATLLPIASLMAGDGDTAREELAAARAIRLAEPQSAAVGLGDIVEVLALLLIGTPDERARWFASRTADFGPMDAYAGRHVQLLWKVARAVAASWAGRSDVVADEVRGLREAEVIPWGAQVARWLDARIHDDERFADIVSPISQNGIPDFPLLEALIHLDLARRTSDRRGDEARSRAERSFTAFGGERLLPLLFPDAPEGRAADPVAASLLAPLSDREREIATLLLEGLSYAQIGRELFITRSTVAFHLTRVYAKTNTTSRHELVEAARAERPPAP